MTDIELEQAESLEINRVLLTVENFDEFEIVGNLNAASQAFIYKILTLGNMEFAKRIHDRKSNKGFSFIPFRFNNVYMCSRKAEKIEKGQKGVLDVCFYTREIFQEFLKSSTLLFATREIVELFSSKMRIVGLEIKSKFEPIPLDSELGAPEYLTLTFITLTWFRLVHSKENLSLKGEGFRLREKIVHSPDLFLMYKSIRDKVEGYHGFSDLVPTVDEFQNGIFLDKIIYFNYGSTFTVRDNQQKERHTGFTGKLRFFVDGEPIIRNKIYNFLLLGSFLGVGARSSMGFGKYVVEAENYNSITQNRDEE